jgi:tubulin-specific chaperone B
MVDSYTIKLHATHDGTNMRLAECRFDSKQTIRLVKEMLSYRFGSNEDMMKLELRDTKEQTVRLMEDDNKSLGDYQALENYTIHVHYSGPNTLGEFDDVSRVEKYTISEEDYNKRDDSFRKFKQ